MPVSSNIHVIAFDCYGTLVRNDADQWIATLHEIALQQELPLTGQQFWAAWRQHEVKFRETRTNMSQPEASPPFLTYWEAWRDAFLRTFHDLGLRGDAAAAADRCVADLGARDPFPDVTPAIEALDNRYRLAVMSNADDDFLLPVIERNRWQFEIVVSSERAKAYKPDPRAFHALSTIAGTAPESILYVGDSPYDDVHGAKLTGMRTLLIQRNQRTPGRTPPPDAESLLEPDYIVESLEELPTLLSQHPPDN